MREVHVSAITDTIKKLCMEANWNLGGEMLRAFDRALTTERSPAGKQVLQILKQNAEMAATKKIAYCQDTGFTVCFVELGQEVHVAGGGLDDAIMAKGGGCENRSKYTMLTPAAGIEGVKDFIVDCVKTAGPDACPPHITSLPLAVTIECHAHRHKEATL